MIMKGVINKGRIIRRDWYWTRYSVCAVDNQQRLLTKIFGIF